MKKFIAGFLLLFIGGNEFLHAGWTTAQQLPSYTIELDSSSPLNNITLVYDAANSTVLGAWGNVADTTPDYSIWNGTSWTTAAAINQGTSSGILFNIGLTYNSGNSTVMAAWGDSNNRAPYYSIWNGTSWSTAATINKGSSSGVNYTVNLAYDANNNTTLAAWRDRTTADPYYSVWNGTSWSAGAIIPEGASNGAGNDIYLLYDPASETVFATWCDQSSRAPYYSIWDGTSWSTAALIPQGTSNGALFNINLTYNSTNNTILAAWGDHLNLTPYYSIWDGTSWSTAATIPQGASAGAALEVDITYDAANNTFIAAWVDRRSSFTYYSVYNETTSSWSTAATLSSISAWENINLVYDPSTSGVVSAWASADHTLGYYSLWNGTSWSTPALIPGGSSTEVPGAVAGDVGLTYDTTSNTVFAAWKDATLEDGYYSAYNGSTWTVPDLMPMGSSTGVIQNINLAYDVADNDVVAAWGDLDFSTPYYSIWNGTSWSNAAPIPQGTSSGVFSNVSLIYDIENTSVVAAWSDANDGAEVYYSVWDGTSWSTADTIPLGTSSGAYNNIALTYDTTSHTVFAAWADNSNSHPYYAKWNGTSWSTAASISLGVSVGVVDNINLTYDGANNTVIAAWADSNIPEGVYSVFNGSSWTPGALIPLGTADIGVNVNLAYDAISQVVVAAWGDYFTDLPYYSLWNGTSWSTAALISQGSSSGVNDNTDTISLTYNAAKGTVVGVWTDSSNQLPYYSVFTGSGVFFPPINLTGNQQKNNFGLTYELYNTLHWELNPANQDISGYYVYRNGVKIATLSASTFSYQDHNRQKRQPDTYSVTSFSSSNESPAAEITIP